MTLASFSSMPAPAPSCVTCSPSSTSRDVVGDGRVDGDDEVRVEVDAEGLGAAEPDLLLGRRGEVDGDVGGLQPAGGLEHGEDGDPVVQGLSGDQFADAVGRLRGRDEVADVDLLADGFGIQAQVDADVRHLGCIVAVVILQRVWGLTRSRQGCRRPPCEP
jgi:hypothetical protein